MSYFSSLNYVGDRNYCFDNKYRDENSNIMSNSYGVGDGGNYRPFNKSNLSNCIADNNSYKEKSINLKSINNLDKYLMRNFLNNDSRLNCNQCKNEEEFDKIYVTKSILLGLGYNTYDYVYTNKEDLTSKISSNYLKLKSYFDDLTERIKSSPLCTKIIEASNCFLNSFTSLLKLGLQKINPYSILLVFLLFFLFVRTYKMIKRMTKRKRRK